MRLASHKRKMQRLKEDAEAQVKSHEAFNSIVQSTFMSTKETAFFASKRRATTPAGNLLGVSCGNKSGIDGRSGVYEIDGGVRGKNIETFFSHASFKLKKLKKEGRNLKLQHSLSQQSGLDKSLVKSSTESSFPNKKTNTFLRTPVIANVSSGTMKISNNLDKYLTQHITSSTDLSSISKSKTDLFKSFLTNKSSIRIENVAKIDDDRGAVDGKNISNTNSENQNCKVTKNASFIKAKSFHDSLEKTENKKSKINSFASSFKSVKDSRLNMKITEKTKKTTHSLNPIISPHTVPHSVKGAHKHSLRIPHTSKAVEVTDESFLQIQHLLKPSPSSSSSSPSSNTPSIKSNKLSKLNSFKYFYKHRFHKQSPTQRIIMTDSDPQKVNLSEKWNIPVLKVTNSHGNLKYLDKSVLDERKRNLSSQSNQDVSMKTLNPKYTSLKSIYKTNKNDENDLLNSYQPSNSTNSSSVKETTIDRKNVKKNRDFLELNHPFDISNKSMKTSFESASSTIPFLKHTSSDKKMNLEKYIPSFIKSKYDFVNRKRFKKDNNNSIDLNIGNSVQTTEPIRKYNFIKSKSLSDLSLLEYHLKKIKSILFKDSTLNKSDTSITETLKDGDISNLNNTQTHLKSSRSQARISDMKYFSSLSRIINTAKSNGTLKHHSKLPSTKLGKIILNSKTLTKLKTARKRNREIDKERTKDRKAGIERIRQGEGEGEEEEYMKMTVPISVCLMIIALYIYLGSLLFSFWEDWDLLTGSYFCFITLSTIGFGDIVPGIDSSEKGAHKKLLLCSLWLVVGLSLLAMCFNLMQEEVKEKFMWLGRKMGILKH